MDSSVIESDTTPRSSGSVWIFCDGTTTSLQRKLRTPNEPRRDHTSGTRVASIYAITSTQMTWQRYDKRRRRDHALGHLNCGNLCGRNLCHTLGVVAGVMDSQVQHEVPPQDETALGDRAQLAAYMPYAPFDLLLYLTGTDCHAWHNEALHEQPLPYSPHTLRLRLIPSK